MKLLIDIPEGFYEEVRKDPSVLASLLSCEKVGEIIANGTPLPKEATNGDMIKTMFPDVEIEENPAHKKCGCFYLKFKGNTCTMVTDYNWWNAPYKADKEG